MSSVEAPVCIACSRMVWRRLEVEAVDELLGRGIYYGLVEARRPPARIAR